MVTINEKEAIKVCLPEALCPTDKTKNEAEADEYKYFL